MIPRKRDYRELVKEVRKQLDLSQEDLARELGVSFATVNRWETGRTRPSRLAIAQLDAFCGRMTEQGALRLPPRLGGSKRKRK
ncbi:MAG: helix-turn-helix transcriptional regulator [Candidatus Eisenbacteria bacterium]